MIYKNLGNTGLKVSVFGYGNWINSGLEDGIKKHYEMIKFMLENGCNFFDTAEMYDYGLGEKVMGGALNKAREELGVQRSDYILTTKLFHGKFKEDKLPINNVGTNRKHLIEGLDRSLKNLNHSYVDILYCHRYDDETPTEEVVRAMKTLIEDKKILYWGTSEWPAIRIMEAMHLCDKLDCPRPIAEQCQYNLCNRNKMEDEYIPLLKDYHLMSTSFSPLFSGVLTGKYNNGIPPDSRLAKNKGLIKYLLNTCGLATFEELVVVLKKFGELANRLGISSAKLAIAWIIKYKYTGLCILGATKVSQLKENIEAIHCVKLITPCVEKELNKIFNNVPVLPPSDKTGKPTKGFRESLYDNPFY